MPNEVSNTASRAAQAAPSVAGALAVLLLGGSFLDNQCLWVDETTQLSGLRLSPSELLPWLAGVDRGRFGVPGDRMPPLSYLFGWCWSEVFGLTETSLRWHSLVLMACAAAVVARTAQRIGGNRMAWTAVAAFVLMPSIVVTSVEIRAYPLFVLCASLVFDALVRLVLAAEPTPSRNLAALAATTLAAIYTHFFGVVLAAGAWSAALIVVMLGGRRWLPVLAAGALTAMLAAGVFPFVFSAVDMSDAATHQPTPLRDIARMLYRLVGHPALGSSPLAMVASLAGALGLALCGARSARGTSAWRAVTAALVVGLGVSAVASLVVHGFNASSPSYNSWALPGFALLLGWGALETGPWRRIAGVSVALLIAGQLYAVVTLERHARLFSHGPHHELVAAIQGAGGAEQTVVIHDPELSAGYFPLYFAYGSRLLQYAGNPKTGTVSRITPSGYEAPEALVSLRAPTVVVVQTRHESAEDVRSALHGAPMAMTPSRLADLLEREGYRPGRSQRVVATSGALIEVLHRLGAVRPRH